MNFEQTKNLIGRVLISAIFIYAIPGKIINFERTVELITSKDIPNYLSPVLLLSAIICLILGSIFFISGFKQRLGASLLLVFIIPTTLIFHTSPLHIKTILMNAGLIGGLLLGLNKSKVSSLKDLFNSQTYKK